jgi:hypothetical protein
MRTCSPGTTECPFRCGTDNRANDQTAAPNGGRPKTDPLTDHLGVFSQLAGRVLMGLGSFVPPRADHVGFASLSGCPEHGGPEPTRPVTMCD